MSEAEELAKKCNEFMRYFVKLPKERRDKYVRDVINYLVRMYNDVVSVMPNIIKAKKVLEEYRKQLMERRHEVIVVLTYVIKPEYQEDVAPLLYALLSLV